MTVTGLSQVYGCKIPKLEFLEWCVANPESSLTRQINGLAVMADGHGLTEYVNALNNAKYGGEEPPEYADHDSEIFGTIGVNPWEKIGDDGILNKHQDLNTLVGLYVPPHDQNADGLLIAGVRVAHVYAYVDYCVPLETQLPFLPGDWTMKSVTEQLEGSSIVGLMGDRKRSLYLVQNDCHCCS